MYVCMYVCVYLRMYVCMYVCNVCMCVCNIYNCLYPSVISKALTSKSDPRSGGFISKNDPTGGSPIAKNDTAKIAWIMLGVCVALSALVVGIIVYRKRAKRTDKRYFIQMLLSLKFRILCFDAELLYDTNIDAETVGDIIFT